MNDEDFDLLLGKCFNQLLGLALALTGYRGLISVYLVGNSFFWLDLLALVAGVSLFSLYEFT